MLRQIESLFQAAADLPAAARADYLDGAGADREVRRRVEAMLAQLERGDTLTRPSPAPEPEGPGTVIGRYTLLERLGEGGFGVVYRAGQREPVVREVALKVIKLGMDTREVVARFEAERQALALMDHPNIAKVLDGGATASGRPYFVMELVRGQPITEHCDHGQLSTRERLALFAEVCRAVQHAHQKGVIHRDLKPSNVLVTMQDGRAVPKVIDFGIAKAIHTRLTARTVHTELQRLMGTPAYMSPEQVERGAGDIDTRSDIYSLGVLLYELLTGSTPFDADTLWRAGLAEVQRVLREEQPPKPSARVATGTSPEVANRRRLDVGGLRKRLRGDLDWIVMKALAKERERRYAAASDLAADVERHLRHEPVLAGPPSAWYRARKLLVRHRVVVASAALLLLAIAAGLVGTGWGMLEAARQDARARREAERAVAVTDFLVETLALADPAVALNPDVSVRALLDRTATRLDTAFTAQPAAEARLRATIGRAYASLGENELAEAQLARAAALLDTSDLADAGALLERFRTLWALTHVRFRLDRADGYATATRARAAGFAALGAVDPRVAAGLERFVMAMSDAAHSRDGAAAAAALPRLEPALAAARAGLPEADPRWPLIADLLMSVAFELWYTEHEPLSIPVLEAALDIRRKALAPGHPDIGEAVAQLATVLNRAGRAAEAERHLRAAVTAVRRAVPPGSFLRAQAESMLGETLVAQGRFGEAEPLLLAAHETIVASVLDEGHFLATDSLGRVIALYDGWGRPAQAAAHRARLLEIGAAGQWSLPWPLARHAFGAERAALLAPLDRFDAAVGGPAYSAAAGTVRPPALAAIVDDALEALAAVPRQDPLRVMVARFFLAWSNQLAPDADPAARSRLADEALATLRPRAATLPHDLAEALSQRAELIAAADPAAALALGREAYARIADAFARDTWLTALAKARVARRLAAIGARAEATALLETASAELAAQFGPEHRHARHAAEMLASIGAPSTPADP